MIYEFFIQVSHAKIEENGIVILFHITIGFSLALIIYLLSIEAHEQGHLIATRGYCKNTNYTCKIVRPYIFSGLKPHTESEYYVYLENNREKEEVQQIIRKIAAIGYIVSFSWLIMMATHSLLLFVIFGWLEELTLFVSLMIAIGFDIKGYLNSSDRNTYKNPADFTYKYK